MRNSTPKSSETTFSPGFRDKCRPDVAVESVDVRVGVKFADSRLNRSCVMRAAHFVMDEGRTTTDGGRGSGRKRHFGFSPKKPVPFMCVFFLSQAVNRVNQAIN